MGDNGIRCLCVLMVAKYVAYLGIGCVSAVLACIWCDWPPFQCPVSLSTEMECRRRLDHAAHAVKLRAGTNSDTFTVSSSDISYGVEHAATRLSFVVMQCAPSSRLKVNNIKIHAAEAVDCARKCPAFADCGDDAVVVHGRRLRGSSED